MRARILWIEGKRAISQVFSTALRKKEYEVEMVSSGSKALARLTEVDPDLIIVNAASLRTSGKRICRELNEKASGIPILVITDKNSTLTDTCANVVLELPFTYRKLLNRIAPLLPEIGENLVHVGPIRLDVEHRRVRCLGREVKLTPRLTQLLQIFLDHPGVVIEREELFRKVWSTEYIGDTRTLDVHISWLRQAIEEDPRKPHFLKTMRGVGYRLDVS